MACAMNSARKQLTTSRELIKRAMTGKFAAFAKTEQLDIISMP